MTENDNNATPEAGSPDGAPNAASEEQVRVLAAAVDELRDKFLRAVAESENIRKRSEREVADARSYGIAQFARDMIGVADNLSRALQAIGPEARESADETLRALLDGVELTGRELQKALQKHGVREIEPTGEKFDPNFHQAMYEVPNPDVPAGTVVQVVQTGYAIADRVLRPALVGVSKGGTRAPAQDRTAGQDAAGTGG
jgi:molecular chaperone GrpE